MPGSKTSSAPDSEFGAWLRLACTPGLGRASARALLSHFGTPEAVLRAPDRARRSVVPARAAQALLEPGEAASVRWSAADAWLREGARRDWVALGDPRYPAALLQIEDPPLLLFSEGEIGLLSRPLVAIVGSRHPTAQGTAHARSFAQSLSGEGWVVVSGLARGIDGAAHEGALAAGGRTIAVVGTGLDTVYPPSHRGLAERIASSGLLLSEYAPGSPPLPDHFPQRNRIIAGLSRGVLVVEAALQSGSLITARLAAEAGREVLAIPGSIHSPQSRGCHALIRQGAKLVETVHDVLEELGVVSVAPAGVAASDLGSGPPEEGDDEAVLLRSMGFDPVTLDDICRRSGWSAQEVAAHLLEFELRGELARLPGGLYQRIRRA